MHLQNLSMILLFVKKPVESAHFYRMLLGCEPVEEHPTFALFVLKNGMQLGVWLKDEVEPSVSAPAGGSEIAFTVEDVDLMYSDLLKKGVKFAQLPTDMDFGRTCVALDLDGHRIRLYKLHKEA